MVSSFRKIDNCPKAVDYINSMLLEIEHLYVSGVIMVFDITLSIWSHLTNLAISIRKLPENLSGHGCFCDLSKINSINNEDFSFYN